MTRLQIENKIKEYETIKTWYFNNTDKWKAEDYKKVDSLCDFIIELKRELILHR